ncbi:MAG: glycosyltransferase family protein [Anaerolineales bacterium]
MVSRVVAIIQARMASSRLPGKVLADLGGQPMLAWVVRRASRAKGIDQVVVATSIAAEDDAVVAFCKEQDYACSRGSLYDVLDRFRQAAQEFDAEVIVRLTGDCPLIDPGMLADNLNTFLSAQPPLDFAANRLPSDRTIPIGLDAEFCTMAALETAWREAQKEHQREHVMPFFYENADRFRTLHIKHHPNVGNYRWTVDTPEDLELMRKVVTYFSDDTFSWQQVLALFYQHPDLARINASVMHKSQYDVDERQ